MTSKPLPWRERVLLTLAIAIPIAYIALVSTFVAAFDLVTATLAAGYVSGGIWLAVIVWWGARLLRSVASGLAASFFSPAILFAFTGLAWSIGLSALTQFGDLDPTWGVTGQIVVGSLAIASLLHAVMSPS